MENNEFEKGIKFSFSDNIEYAEKAVVSKHILKKDTGNISLFAFYKGESLSEHTTPYDAMVTIVDGKADIIINQDSNILETGDTIILPAKVPHAIKAIESFKMVLTMIKSL